MSRSKKVEGLEVWVDYEPNRKRAWVEIWFDKGVDREKLKDKVKELSEILDKYDFVSYGNNVWDVCDIEFVTVKKFVNELKRKGYKIKYNEYDN